MDRAGGGGGWVGSGGGPPPAVPLSLHSEALHSQRQAGSLSMSQQMQGRFSSSSTSSPPNSSPSQQQRSAYPHHPQQQQLQHSPQLSPSQSPSTHFPPDRGSPFAGFPGSGVGSLGSSSSPTPSLPPPPSPTPCSVAPPTPPPSPPPTPPATLQLRPFSPLPSNSPLGPHSPSAAFFPDSSPSSFGFPQPPQQSSGGYGGLPSSLAPPSLRSSLSNPSSSGAVAYNGSARSMGGRSGLSSLSTSPRHSASMQQSMPPSLASSSFSLSGAPGSSPTQPLRGSLSPTSLQHAQQQQQLQHAHRQLQMQVHHQSQSQDFSPFSSASPLSPSPTAVIGASTVHPHHHHSSSYPSLSSLPSSRALHVNAGLSVKLEPGAVAPSSFPPSSASSFPAALSPHHQPTTPTSLSNAISSPKSASLLFNMGSVVLEVNKGGGGRGA